MDIAGQTILVTGGGSGLGEACVRHMHDAGANVLIADVNEQAGVALANSLGQRTRFCQTDVTNSDHVSRAIQAAIDQLGPLRGTIHCAGILAAAKVVGRDAPHDLELFRRTIEVNLIGTFNVMRLAAFQMARNQPNADGERGVIINTASVAAFEGQMGQSAYAASKGGVASLTLPAARDLARDGIRVVAIAPGVFHTPMIDAAPDKVQQSLRDQTVFPTRLGKPQEFAAFAQHIFENPMLNGCVLRLDGAIRMSAK
jgi:NAD(P)-dependent dehydrogenase (short-subunit alcohol dehydrogenase family)